MTREEAAALLGVDAQADPTQVRQAWRVWARLAHPDAGGDGDHFRRLVVARDVLLADTELDPNPAIEPAPRASLRSVCRMPTPRALAGIVAFTLVAFAAGFSVRSADPWAAALVLGGLATAAVAVMGRAILQSTADVGHRITFLALAWLPIAAVQVTVLEFLGGSVITALPVMVLPFVIAVALVNPGAGLWRPVPVMRDAR